MSLRTLLLLDEEPSGRPHIGPFTRAMPRRIEGARRTSKVSPSIKCELLELYFPFLSLV